VTDSPASIGDDPALPSESVTPTTRNRDGHTSLFVAIQGPSIDALADAVAQHDLVLAPDAARNPIDWRLDVAPYGTSTTTPRRYAARVASCCRNGHGDPSQTR
jgi:hypothetical protein